MKNAAALLFIAVFIVELYFASAGSSHRRKKLIRGWNPVKGRIVGIEKKFDQLLRKNVMELTIEAAEGRIIYAKDSALFCIYEEGEEVDLMEKDGVHRFRGNERVDRKGRKEILLGTIPMLVIVAVSALGALLF